jgi:hypothetical protein
MKVLVACEWSGVVRDAFRRRGHEAYSCDLLDSACPAGLHFRCDVRPLLRKNWDLVIAHPPCTYLADSGARYLNRPGRRDKMYEGVKLFVACLLANAPRVCVENPRMCGEAARIIGVPHSQIVHPYMFGEPVKKATCLWLVGLPKLVPFDALDPREATESNRNMSPSPQRSRERSITYVRIARAMAEQWGRDGG